MTKSESYIGKILIAVLCLYILGQRVGPYFFDNNWSFNHFNFLSIFWQILWVIAIPGLFILINRYNDKISDIFQSKKSIWIGGAVMLGLLILFRFDSFIYGDGNLLVNRIAIEKTGSFAWFESGTIGIIIGLYKTIYYIAGYFTEATAYRQSLFAGVNAIVLYSFLCTVFSMVGSYKIARLISGEKNNWWQSFLIIMLGPQMLMMFGYPGFEPSIVVFTIWISYYILQFVQNRSIPNLGFLWILQLVALLFALSNLYLLPVTVATTLLYFIRQRKMRWVPFSIAGILSISIIVTIYSLANSDFRFSQFIMGINGIKPHTDYGIFSVRHIGDILQLLWMLFPQALILFAILFISQKDESSTENNLLLLMSACGFVTIFVMNPVHSIPFDAPSFSIFLTPLAILLALVLSKNGKFFVWRKYSLAPTLTAFVIFIMLGLYPVYGSIDRSAEYMEDYFDKNNHYYFVGSSSFRDSYFYQEQYTKADRWDLMPTSRSEEYINFRGCTELYAIGNKAEPLQQLPKIILQFPYWTAPRELLADIQLGQGRLELAKAQIDTCLMLEPRNIRHYQKAYLYFRDSRSYPEALAVIDEALLLSPDNPDLLIDLMVGNQFAGKLQEADSLADHIIKIDSTQPFPHAIKGFIYEQKKDYKKAITSYEKFVTMAPEDIETPKIRKRLNALVVKLRDEKD